jgi:hypothetical protein
MKSRRQRLALELLGPPLLGGALATLWAWGTVVFHSLYRHESPWEVLGTWRLILILWPVYGLFAFPAVGAQTACYAAVMEWGFSRGLDPRSWRAVALSGGLGYLSALPLALGYGYERRDTWWFFSLLGPVVGLTLGLLMRRWSPRPAVPVLREEG